MAIQENRDPLEPSLDPNGGEGPTSQDFLEPEEDGGEAPLFVDAELLTFIGDTKRRSRNFQQIVVMAMWESSEAAYRSEHQSGSKYKKDQYKNRAKYFKPKTRAAVRKNLTATVNALFASQDVLSCEASDDSNDLQRANASLLKEIINQRFNNKTMKSGVPWFLTAIGARLQAQISGIVCSKQDWSYRCVERPITIQKEAPLLDGMGQPYVDQMTGEPFMQMIEEDGIERDVVVDKPTVTLLPSEMVLLDPGTGWINPAQTSPTLIAQWPMHVDAVKAMMKDDKKRTPWREVSDELLRQGYFSDSELMGLKAAREGTAAASNTLNRPSGSFGGLGSEIVDVWDVYFRRHGVDYQFWSIRDKVMLSDPIPVEEAHPAQRGSRPYVIGTDQLEVHVLYPESAVHSWRQTQDEINDFANLTMDGNRLSVYPTAKVVAGRNIDYKAVQRRDAQGMILVREPNDVTWDRPTANTSGTDRMVQLLSNDFDELAGVFSQNSVQSNRQIGDTVGGMQLISASANATSEFDLKVFIETWAEPVISQVVALEQYYEDDETILQVAGNKAKLFQKFGVDQVTDELLESQVNMTLSIGTGGSDPMQGLIRFDTVMKLAMPMIGLAMKEGKAELNFEEIFTEIFAKGGFKNGSERFIKLKEGGQPQIPPEAVQQLMHKLQELQGEVEQLKAGHEADLAKTQMQEEGETQRTVLKSNADLQLQDDQQAHERLMSAIGSLLTPYTVQVPL